MDKVYHPLILRLLQRPGWQLALGIAGLLLLLLAGGYLLGIAALVQSTSAHEQTLQQQEAEIIGQQRILLRQRARSEWQTALAAIATPPAESTALPQYVIASLDSSGGRLLHWQPDERSGEKGEKRGGLRQQGTFRLQIPFARLLPFLTGLLLTSAVPLAIEQLTVSRRDESAAVDTQPLPLEVTLRLASYQGRAIRAEAEPAYLSLTTAGQRDPFQRHGNPVCQPRSGQMQLKGIVGGPGRYTAWLLSAQDQWLKAQAGELLASEAWRVDQVSEHQVYLSLDDPQCGARQQVLSFAAQ
ncbi:hypothetical protein GW590_16490 [Rahnella sp. SAP-1]|uniref:Uncharacterized protein n=1 Tax=Rouxiella aceris TaxID=2703884 RepID=A0A848MNL1_9GAMM|nr:hypothetical protein [Rouxiella aceris]NMP28462.1 hypothetical protein [Rouxiella aceris]